MKNLESHFTPDSCVLIIGYKRTKNILRLIHLLEDFGAPNVLVYLDRASQSDAETLRSQDELIIEIERFKTGTHKNLDFFVSSANQKCAVTVLSAISYAFENFRYVYVLEDDCIPTEGFFEFVSVNRELLETTRSLWLICGSQFVPPEITERKSIISRYALTWGWFTSRAKWQQIRELMFDSEDGPWPSVSFIEKTYWKAGRRRALSGFTDVWDTVLLATMLAHDARSLLPPYSLVTNIGNDIHATHTKNASQWLNVATKDHLYDFETQSSPEFADLWLKRNVFGISSRHLISTRITCLLDELFKSRRKFELGLRERLKNGPWLF